MAVKDVADKQARALALHLQGASYDQIAELLGYASKAGAHKAVQSALKNRVPSASREDAYRTEAARLDLVLTALSPLVRKGDPKSVALFLAASERRTEVADLIAASSIGTGADAPATGVRTPIDEINARRASRGTARGAARGPNSTHPSVSSVLPD